MGPPRLGGASSKAGPRRHPRQDQNHQQQQQHPSALKKRAMDAAAPSPKESSYPPPPPRPPPAAAGSAADGADGGGDAAATAAFPPPPPLTFEEAERSSRLCIKGLPAYVTEQRLRDHLRAASRKDAADAAAGMTDLKLLRTRDGGAGGSGPAGAGASRRMAFVGFRSEADADAVRCYFDRTFLDASRLAVEVRLYSFMAPAPSRRRCVSLTPIPPP
jgi:hypothetical protein